MDGPDNPRLLSPAPSPAPSTSSSVLDHLFDSCFDYPALVAASPPLKAAAVAADYPASPLPAPEDLSALVTDYPASFLDHHLSLDHLGSGLISMRPFDDPAPGSEYSGQATPDLVQGGSTSPSDHSGPLLPDHHPDDSHPRPNVTLREAQAHDDEWTYPQTEPAAKAASRRYPPTSMSMETVTSPSTPWPPSARSAAAPPATPTRGRGSSSTRSRPQMSARVERASRAESPRPV